MKAIILALVMLLPFSKVYAEDVNALKAAYLFYFSKFMTWENKQERDVVNICIYKMQSDMAVQVESLKDKKINGKPLNIKNIDNLNGISDCQVAYVGSYSLDINPNMIQKLVVVSNKGNNLSDIQFFVNNGKLRFSIDRQKIESKSIKVSSRLLRLSSR